MDEIEYFNGFDGPSFCPERCRHYEAGTRTNEIRNSDGKVIRKEYLFVCKNDNLCRDWFEIVKKTTPNCNAKDLLQNLSRSSERNADAGKQKQTAP